MSRVGKLPIQIPAGVDVALTPDAISVKGAKGSLSMALTKAVHVTHQNNELVIAPSNKDAHSRAMWGTVRSRVNNMVRGVTTGFTKQLDIKGVGYRAALAGNVLTLSLGYSHEIKFIVPADITVKVEKQTQIEISGIDNQKVGRVAAELRGLRKPEPYKGKGVRYSDEYVRMKEGKKK
jgi:large subunit ribosomal protein L6